MPHETSLIAVLTAGVGLAFIFGLVAVKLKLPPLLGYLVAGLAVGPFTPGFVADGAVAFQLSEIGVTLLMFGVGLHFSLRDLNAVRKYAVPGALIQMAIATLLGLGAGMALGIPWGASLLFGLCLSVASTVVLLRALESRGETESTGGRVAIGWLVMEDILFIVAIVLLPVLASQLGGKADPNQSPNLGYVLVETMLKIVGFGALMLIAGRQLLPKLLGRVFRNGPRELFTVGVVAVALGIAFGAAKLLGISPALGAFLAGVVISESELSHQTSAEIKPLSTVFAVLFFVSVGMLFDPSVLIKYPIQVAIGVLIVLFGKTLGAIGILRLFKFPWPGTMLIAGSLAQIGELSFILAGLGLKYEVFSQGLMSVVLAVGVLSIAINPLVLQVMSRQGQQWGKQSETEVPEESVASEPAILSQTPLEIKDHVVIVGYGRVGRIVEDCLLKAGIPYVVVDFDQEIARQVTEHGAPVVLGDATQKRDLRRANIEAARLLMIATPANSETRAMIETARVLCPDLPICVRTHSLADYGLFNESSVQRAVLGELETALEMVSFALAEVGVDELSADAIVDGARHEVAQRASRLQFD
ncbi:MAG: YbaL family putative K(+) efflux transporter [Fimbriimonadaceae bacterium]